MLRNYIKIAIRTLLKHKSFSAINIFGLAMSMSVCLLILLFIVYQRSYDRFHEHSDRLYRVYSDYKAAINPSSQLYATAPINMARLMRQGYTGVEEAIQIRKFGGQRQRQGQWEAVGLSGLYPRVLQDVRLYAGRRRRSHGAGGALHAGACAGGRRAALRNGRCPRSDAHHRPGCVPRYRVARRVAGVFLPPVRGARLLCDAGDGGAASRALRDLAERQSPFLHLPSAARRHRPRDGRSQLPRPHRAALPRQ